MQTFVNLWAARPRAQFRPIRMDNLRPEAKANMGIVTTWLCVGVMDEGPYTGQQIWIPTDHKIGFGWVPQCDLVEMD